MECGLSCARSCRDLSRDIKCNEECVPGCQCPNGKLLSNENRCVSVSQCPCIYEEKVIQPGDSVSVGNCKTWYDLIFNKDVDKVILSVQVIHLFKNFNKSSAIFFLADIILNTTCCMTCSRCFQV